MKNISVYIKALMFEHDYVSVPNLGAFILNYQSAQLSDGKFEPPTRQVSFNELLRQDDGLLTTHLSSQLGVSFQDAKKHIEDYVHQIKTSLYNKEEIDLVGIGKLYLSSEGSICFKPGSGINYCGDSFGFESIYTSRISTPTHSIFIDRYMTFGDMESIEIPTDNSNYKRINFRRTLAYTVPFIFLILLAGISKYLDRPSTIFDEPKALSSLNPVDYLPHNPVQQAPVLQDDDMRIEETPASTLDAVPTKKSTHKIVVGFFAKEQNAFLLDKLLRDNDFNSQIENWKTYKRVYVHVLEGENVDEISKKLEQLVGEKGVVLKSENE
ncbi:MAG: hypothetical protein ACK4R6_01950 [Spirosomataceae bacterium]